MPNYDYQCQKCGHEFEVFQSMNDDKLTDCPEDSCDGQVKRLMGTGAGIIFKGSGFYETDYKRGADYKAAAKADSSSGSKSSSSSSKSESKKSSSSSTSGKSSD